jgi:hypothetical protein
MAVAGAAKQVSRNDITEVCDLMLWDPPIISKTVFWYTANTLLTTTNTSNLLTSSIRVVSCVSCRAYSLFSPLQVAVVLVANDSDLMASIFSLVFAAIIAIFVRALAFHRSP